MPDSKNLKIIMDAYSSDIEKSILKLKTQRVVERIWDKDYTLWSDKPDEITNRLGWLNSPDKSLELFEEINNFTETVKRDGFKYALLLGMGGSSLAPEVFSKIFGTHTGYLQLGVIDSTHPQLISDFSDKYDPAETLYIVSTKSGGTVETFSFMKYFYNLTQKKLGKVKAGKQFIAITDPGSGLESIAKELNFRKIFLNDPNIGGRYSALSLFGIVPASLLGIDIKRLLHNASLMAHRSLDSGLIDADNTPAKLGVIMGTLAEKGLNKITFITSSKLYPFCNWLEQLIAESTGKIGKGIVPVINSSVFDPDYYPKDNWFVYFKLENDTTYEHEIKKLINSGFPVVEIVLKDIYDLGGEFFRWEMATIVAGWQIGIQPFDQPNVESAKILTRELLADYEKDGKVAEVPGDFEFNNIKVLTSDSTKNRAELFQNYFTGSESYFSIQAYVNPTKQSEKQLNKFQSQLQTKYKICVTLGYGPRFLHSTGQLHKGDDGRGLFLQLISESGKNLQIPLNPGEEKSAITFGTLIKAQALGDRNALINEKRKVITFIFNDENIESNLGEIAHFFE